MITGEVTPDREAIIRVRIGGPLGEKIVRAVIDTGFTEFLTLPSDIVDSLGLQYDGAVPMTLANEVEEDFDVHIAWIEWFGQRREILILKADGDPLIGWAS